VLLEWLSTVNDDIRFVATDMPPAAVMNYVLASERAKIARWKS